MRALLHRLMGHCPTSGRYGWQNRDNPGHVRVDCSCGKGWVAL